MCLKLPDWLTRGRYAGRVERLRYRLSFTMEHYAAAAAYLKRHGMVLARGMACMILSRRLAYYVQMLLGGCMTAAAQFRNGRRM